MQVASPALDTLSRGVLDLGPVLVLPDMQAVASELELDLSGHRARAVERGELRGVDLVLGFEPSHVAAAVVDGGSRRERTFTLLEFVNSMDPFGDEGDGLDSVRSWVDDAHRARSAGNPLRAPGIEDPLGRSPETFRRVAAQVDESVARLAVPLKQKLVE